MLFRGACRVCLPSNESNLHNSIFEMWSKRRIISLCNQMVNNLAGMSATSFSKSCRQQSPPPPTSRHPQIKIDMPTNSTAVTIRQLVPYQISTLSRNCGVCLLHWLLYALKIIAKVIWRAVTLLPVLQEVIKSMYWEGRNSSPNTFTEAGVLVLLTFHRQIMRRDNLRRDDNGKYILAYCWHHIL